MSDDPTKQAPFANPVPPAPPSPEEVAEKEEADRKTQQEEMERMANEPPPPLKPLTDDKVYQTPPTNELRKTHSTMSTEDLEALGHNEDGQAAGEQRADEPQPVEDQRPPAEEDEGYTE
jgi:hypothetical protein